MKTFDLFQSSDYDKDIKGVIIKVIDTFVVAGYIFTKYLCYTKDHKLVILAEEELRYVSSTFTIEEELVPYSVTIPKCDELMELATYDNYIKIKLV